ncbi:hypothetical protein GOP47_0002006 [Adiantum capillus-veneris]|uniref:Translocation and assembly module TamB C-terminal domain-containing protein n=1 Tax=Adiantum capillus-veneris TaxID=13818 RepID=A0A9D4VAV4_ADICA|nr:hypothetical protein GOP47_0002006 [Adiantum capillus-veneris]
MHAARGSLVGHVVADPRQALPTSIAASAPPFLSSSLVSRNSLLCRNAPFLGATFTNHRKKKRRKKKETQYSTPFLDNDYMLSPCCYSGPHPSEDGTVPPTQQFTSRWLPTQPNSSNSQSTLNFRNDLLLHPAHLSRIVGCWCRSKMRNGGRAVFGATHNFLYENSVLLLRGAAFVGSVVLLGVLSLYAQAKAQTHIQKYVLPPVANIVSTYLGRKVELGKVHSVSPLGLTLESCSLGPHEKEFSCGELPLVEIRMRPFTSIQRRQIVLDAVLLQPNLLVCQKKDWSWLGIPTPTEKSFHRKNDEEGLDGRTKARRLFREQMGLRLAKERDAAARKAAETGYVLCSDVHFEEFLAKARPHDETGNGVEKFSPDLNMGEGVHQGIGESWPHAVHNGDIVYESFQEEITSNNRKVLSKSLTDCKSWVDKHLVSPVPLFKHWSSKSTTRKAEGQQRNLEASAAAARAYFEQLGHTQGIGLNGGAKKQPMPEQQKPARTAGALSNNSEDMEFQSALNLDDQGALNDMLKSESSNEKVTADLSSVNAVQTDANTRELANMSFPESTQLRTMLQEESWWKRLFRGKNARIVIEKPKFEFKGGAKGFADSLVAQAKSNLNAAPLQKWLPVNLDTVYVREGTLMLLAYGDAEPRVMENINGRVKLGSRYEQVDVHVIGKLQQWRTPKAESSGGRLLVKVVADIRQQKWHVKLRGKNLFAPLLERLLEIPLDWLDGRASGELSIWASKGDSFPNLAGRLAVSKLGFKIWEAPSAFKDVSGTLFIQGQRLFLHNTHGFFGVVPLHVSGDMDLNPDGGEYRLVCQVPNVEINALMKTLKARPPLFSLAGAIKAAVYCRGPLEVPVFAGSAEISKKNMTVALNGPTTAASEAVKQHESRGAVAAFDRIPFSYASANFTFDTDNCMADVYGIRATLVDGGELRGAGNLWICPEGEVDTTAVNMDLSGLALFDSVVQNYLPASFKVSPIKLNYIHGEAKIQGSLLQPVFDIKWNAPEAKGAFNGVRGDINISHDAIAINSSAYTFDLSAKIHTAYPTATFERRVKSLDLGPSPPDIEGLDVDLRMRGFDCLGLVSPNLSGIAIPSATEGIHTKLTGRAKFQGRVVKLSENVEIMESSRNQKIEAANQQGSGVTGEILLSGMKLNQFLVAPHLSGSMDIFPTKFRLNAVGRADEHLTVNFSKDLDFENLEQRVPLANLSAEPAKQSFSFLLERGPLRMYMDYKPGQSAKLEVRNLQLDELELASLRGTIQKADTQLNFQKRKGHGILSVRRPRFSGVQGESLDLSCRWSGDVITLEQSVLEQASSRYELQGEYVLPGPRDHFFAEKDRGDGSSKTAMAGQLGSFMTSLGRWRLQLEVPGAEVTDMLPVARLLSRSSDPAVVSRSKELFMQAMQHAGFSTENMKQQLESLRHNKEVPTLEEGAQESIPLPGLAELKGHWHGTFDASGGGNGDTSADFDFHGEEWEWGSYKIQRVSSAGSFNNNDGLHLDKIFIQKDTATLHADGTLLGPKSNLHFAVLNFPIGLVPPLLHAVQSSTMQPVPYQTARAPISSIRGILYMEGDLRGPLAKPQCDVQVRLLDGVIGGVDLGCAEVVASITSANRLNFNAKFEPVVRSGHVRLRGSLPLEATDFDAPQDDEAQEEVRNLKRSRGWNRNKSKAIEENDTEEKKIVRDRLGDDGWEVHLAESLKELDWDFSDKGAVQMDATVKDGGMMLITALSPHLHWLQGNADLTLQVRGTVDQPTVDGVASFHRVSISSPVLPRPLSNFGGTIRVVNNQLRVEGLEGRVGRKGRLYVKGKLPLRASEPSFGNNVELRTDYLEVRAKNMFSGQVDSQMRFTGSILEPEVSGMIKLSHGEAYLPQEKGVTTAASTLASSLTGMAAGGKMNRFPQSDVGGNLVRFPQNDVGSLPDHLRDTQAINGNEDKTEEKKEQMKSLVAVGLKNLKLVLGPELRVVYPLILNFAVSGELELNGLADPQWIKPKGTLTFENGDVNLVATQVRLNRDHPNRARFEPEQGLDPTLDLALVGADWQLKVQGRARNWQDNLVITSRSGEPDDFTRTEAARVFESQLADSLLEGNGQLAFKKLAAATVETLMPKIEGKGEFGQARWRLVSAPQIPNLLSLDPTTDPFKSLANLSFGTEVEVQLGKRLQASVVRQLKESEMATQWTLIYHLSNKLRVLFSSIPSVDNRLLFEYSATSQN